MPWGLHARPVQSYANKDGLDKDVMAVFFVPPKVPQSAPARMPQSTYLRATFAAVAAFLMTIPLFGLGATPTFAATPPGCPDVLLIGARGSGETALRSSGLGPEVLTLYKQMQSDLGNKLSTDSLPVDYPAASVDVLKPDSDVVHYVQNHLDPYLASIDQGIKSVLNEFTTKAQQCPQTRFVLAGYSQGALVMHQVLINLYFNNAGLLNRIAATALIADPDRLPKTAATSVWSSKDPPQSSGIRFYFLGGYDIPPAVAADTFSICNEWDFVCDFNQSSLQNYKAEIDIHTSYVNTKLVKGVGTRIANRLLPPATSLGHIVISPNLASIQSGQTQKYTAAGYGSLNNLLGDVTVSTKFSIVPDGLCTGSVCTATIPGPHTVIGTYGKLRATAALNVQPAATGPAHLYWPNYSAGNIARSNLDGTAVTTLVTGQNAPHGMALDGSHAYWISHGDGNLNRSNLDGSGVTTLVTGQNYSYGIAVDSSHLYWTSFYDGTISEANLDGSGVTTLVAGLNRPYGLALDSSHIYWTDYYGAIYKANLDGTGVTAIVTGLNSGGGIAVDGGHIYWADISLGTISKANLDGTGATTLVAGQNSPYGVAVDSGHVYWTSLYDSTIRDANLDGTGVTTLLSGQDAGFLALGP